MSETWTTREGVVLQIAEMETSHLINCLKLLLRNAVKWALAHDRRMIGTSRGSMLGLPEPHGEMARELWSMDDDDDDDAPLHFTLTDVFFSLADVLDYMPNSQSIRDELTKRLGMPAVMNIIDNYLKQIGCPYPYK